MKKIIPAVCMSLLGLAAVGTGSYAWFTANATVTATGLSVTAKTGASLQIYAGYTDDKTLITATTATITDTQTGISPVKLLMDNDYQAASGTFESGVEYFKIDTDGSYKKLVAGTDYTIDDTIPAGILTKLTSTHLSAQLPASWSEVPTLSTKGIPATYKEVGKVALETGFDEAGDYMSEGVVSIYRNSDNVDGTYSLAIKASVGGIASTSICDLDKALMASVLCDSGTDRALEFNSVNFASGLSTSATEEDLCTLTGLKNNTIYHLRFMEWYDGDNQYCTTNAAEKTLARAMNFSMSASESN